MKTFVAGFAVAFTLALSAAGAKAATISLSPASQTGATGSLITVDLNVSGLGNGTALSSFDISVNFDSAALAFQSASFGDPALGDQLDLGHLGLNGPTARAGTGTADLIETDIFDSPATLLANQASGFTLAALSFSALGAGTTPVTLTVNSLADQIGNPLAASTQNASVTITPSTVPLPSAIWLLASGLGGLGALSRRRNVA